MRFVFSNGALCMATGIDAASSTYACIWCKCPKDLRFDLDYSKTIYCNLIGQLQVSKCHKNL